MSNKAYIITLAIFSVLLVLQAFVGTAEVKSKIIFTGIGSADILVFGSANTNHTVVSDTYWAWDKAKVVAGDEALSVLDQYVFADAIRTHISRNALFIGPGSIETISQYNASNTEVGEDSVSGIFVQGEGYGALIQYDSLEFNPNFGGITEAVATGGVNYTIGEFGGFGNIDGSENYIPGDDDSWSSVILSGYRSGMIESSGVGSKPQPGPDIFKSETASWARGNGSYSFGANSPSIDVYLYLEFTCAKLYTLADFERLKAQGSLSANDY